MLLVTGFVLGEVCSLCSSIIRSVIILLLSIGAILFLWKDRDNKKKRWLLLLPFFLVGGSWYYGYFTGESSVEKEMLQEQAGTMEGTVVSIVGKASGNVVYLQNCMFQDSSRMMQLPGQVVVFSVKDTESLKLGNQIRLTGKLIKIQPPANFGQFNSVVYYNSRNIYYQYKQSSCQVINSDYWHYRNGLRKMRDTMEQVYLYYLGERDAGIISAMVLGQKTYLEEDRKELYQENGIAHILAISGLHVGLLGMLVYKRLRRLLLPAPFCAGISIWLLISYGMLSGMGSAALRAIIMLIVTIIGDMIGRTSDMLTSMGLAGFFMLLMNPIQLLDAGFLLSYGAIVGIGGIAPALEKIMPGNHWLAQGFRSGLAVQLGTTPILLYFYYELAPYFIILNLLVIPLMSVLLPCAIAVGTVGYYVQLVGKLFRIPVVFILKVYDWLCSSCSGLPVSNLVIGKPSVMAILIYYVILMLALYCLQNQRWKQTGILFFIVLLMVCFVPEEEPGISMLDVGQGDCIYMNTGEHHYLIDGGSSSVGKVGQYRIEPFLKAKGVGRLDGVILTHMDTDHISGVEELLNRGYPIDTLILGDIKDKTQYDDIIVLAEQNGTVVQYMAIGDKITDNNCSMICLHPVSGYEEENTNANSIVLDVTMGNRHMLFTGDLGQEQEKEILSNPYIKTRLQNTRYALLKVGHHGSKNSSGEEFLAVIKPDIAIISCGEDNSYGHPHRETLERLEEVESEFYVTMEQGEIDILILENGMEVHGFLQKEK